MRWVLLCCLGLVLVAGCGEDNPANVDQGPPDYLPNTSPANLIANLEIAWEAMDAAGYVALLYGGEQTATDGAFYAPCKFHCVEGGGLDLPAFWVESREAACAERLLGGLPGDEFPGVKSLSLDLSPIGTWDAMGGDEIAGDAFPPTAQWCLHTAGMLVTLKSGIGGGDTDQIAVNGRFLFQCLPVEVEGVTEWRLWKWWDETNRSERAIPVGAVVKSLSEVKACFAPPGPAYLPNDSPDHLVANLVMAWEGLDPSGYAALLYDGSEAASDGEHYAPFAFYFADAGLPISWSCTDEQACAETLLGEEPGGDAAGVDGIACALTAAGDWQALAAGEVEGDPCPAGTQSRSFDTDLLLTLKATSLGEINAFSIQDRALLYCLPVQAGGGTEWRLWKWRDLLIDKALPVPSPGPVKASIGQVKALYGP